jgi:hypothetical protein
MLYPPSDGDIAAGTMARRRRRGGRVAEEAMKAEGKKDLDTRKTNILSPIALYEHSHTLKLKISFNIASLYNFYQ